MTIERVNLPDPISRLKKSAKTVNPKKARDTDSIQVSDDAKNKAEIYNATEKVRMASDIRTEKIDEIKRKLDDPNYITNTVLEKTAENIMEFFGI
jgi:negative regulator of flagellin synthesis FlgM